MDIAQLTASVSSLVFLKVNWLQDKSGSRPEWNVGEMIVLKCMDLSEVKLGQEIGKTYWMRENAI